MKKKLYITIILVLIISFILSSFIQNSICALDDYFILALQNIKEINSYDENDFYCANEGYEFKKGDYLEVAKAVSDETSTEYKMLAYIAVEGDETTTSGASAKQGAIWAVYNKDKYKFGDTYKYNGGDVYYHLVDIVNDKWQGASTGSTSGIEGISKSKFATLYKEADEYAQNGGKKEITINSSNVKTPSYTDSKVICGPYEISSTENVKISLNDANCYISDSDGNKLTKIPDTKKFYITINRNNVNEYSEKNITLFEQEYTTYELTTNEYWINKNDTTRIETKDILGKTYYTVKAGFRNNSSKNCQDIIHIEGKKNTKSEKISLTLPNIIPSLNVKFKKLDQSGNALEGAKFKLEVIQNSKTKEYTATSDDEGLVTFEKITPESADDIELILYEIETPKGYSFDAERSSEWIVKQKYKYENRKMDLR